MRVEVLLDPALVLVLVPVLAREQAQVLSLLAASLHRCPAQVSYRHIPRSEYYRRYQ
jgi:hypothetical protein